MLFLNVSFFPSIQLSLVFILGRFRHDILFLTMVRLRNLGPHWCVHDEERHVHSLSLDFCRHFEHPVYSVFFAVRCSLYLPMCDLQILRLRTSTRSHKVCIQSFMSIFFNINGNLGCAHVQARTFSMSKIDSLIIVQWGSILNHYHWTEIEDNIDWNGYFYEISKGIWPYITK